MTQGRATRPAKSKPTIYRRLHVRRQVVGLDLHSGSQALLGNPLSRSFRFASHPNHDAPPHIPTSSHPEHILPLFDFLTLRLLDPFTLLLFPPACQIPVREYPRYPPAGGDGCTVRFQSKHPPVSATTYVIWNRTNHPTAHPQTPAQTIHLCLQSMLSSGGDTRWKTDCISDGVPGNSLWKRCAVGSTVFHRSSPAAL